MKASVILTLPVLALAAATPAKVEERQVDPLTCLNGIQGLRNCIDPQRLIANPTLIFGIIGCLPPAVLGTVFGCLSGLPIPVKE
ncbi:uncharacterized protein B0J16DRAFT_346018 [Fusarium flagelliforme]|uniref:uncharacterized protein n=1 Tax=Fusarium flagelliforme TaxID=2675880 RepID=UPI001E8CA004|nr:uncharacterized protein B0J16DRAFT_346018 [Fusarium flagelliforme]KAH7183614.1 hypothetical protein B0J16DRAFT_346018 [Fusarium flagelliforme]